MQGDVADRVDDSEPTTIARYLLRYLHRRVPTADNPALIEGERAFTWHEVALRSAAFAASLAASGSEPDDRIAYVVDPTPSIDTCIAFFGAALAGVVVVPVNERFTGTERDAVLAAAEPVRVVYADELAELSGRADAVSADDLPGYGRPDADFFDDDFFDDDFFDDDFFDDDFFIVCSSGTTGAAKGIRCSHRNAMASAVAVNAALDVSAADRWLCCLPLVHVGALAVLWRAVVAGCAIVVSDPAAPDLCSGAPTVASLVPTQLYRLVRDEVAVPERLRCVLLGGAGVGDDLYARAVAAGWPVRPSYGLSEMCSTVAISPGPLRGAAAVPAAVPVDGVTCVVRDGSVLLDGAMRSPGHAWGSGPAEVIVHGRRFLDTCDLGELDADGRIRIVGRADAVIVVGGENVHPEEVESVLSAHPAVAAALVVGRDDLEKGRVPVASVVPVDATSPPSPEDLRVHCRARLAAYKVPVRFEIVDDVARTASGKIRRD